MKKQLRKKYVKSLKDAHPTLRSVTNLLSLDGLQREHRPLEAEDEGTSVLRLKCVLDAPTISAQTSGLKSLYEKKVPYCILKTIRLCKAQGFISSPWPLLPPSRRPPLFILLAAPFPSLSLSRPTKTQPLKPTPNLTTLLLLHGKPCMGDPDVDHGFVFDDQGRTDVIASPFFDVHFGNDETADDYIDRILYQLTLAIEAQIPPGRWYIIGRPSSSPNSATSPATTTLWTTCLLAASLSSALRDVPEDEGKTHATGTTEL
ncbi:hypothetical protein M5K25_013340 [Dendrobium thyrsiflorum]|uniref:Uncharacterized protein n=1 Tax=Dendrobium thyrsiflorum TaxID=117978 RepID=A0ABD0UZK6_DENTH